MPSLAELGHKPAHVTADEHFAPWFAEIVGRLMNNCDFIVAGGRYRFAELEVYYSGGAHPDLFAHRDPVQLEDGRWYFHRTRGEYRGGSFKGLDIALGDGTSYFGILIRTVVADNGTMLDGPCVMVDHLLAQTKTASVAVLDGAINQRKIWDTTSPIHIIEAATPRTAPVFSCSRVGLSLKKSKGKPDAPKFVGRAYRFLTEAMEISKGRPHLILALHRAGHDTDAIHATTGVAKKTIDRYVADFALGKQVENFDGYIGTDLGTADLCKLLGTWASTFAAK
ncbi:Uncharacterized protein OS=Cystobacter violaceus Cb vi76 GN=Q664_03580 PE=4 SV=1 [Gemmata massiliana]|uniref:Uncharacterized protein n=1 Tax=Gemmata massiliana TaxID=1210884 RepID=A0A6P2CYL0_9BACT|nr:hypothetical protein [Gemmata massiliana]VTR92232.1 Uncharacterized protein OS=Cystobacter violaceus Cb vi76 GN=Q664_03580 PE=4 SV=1 [Gemmata massiliana]